MLSVRNVHLARGDQPIFEGLSFAVHPGQKVGIVGANGIGKSTLFALLRRKLHAESGEVDIPATWRIGYMAQEVEPSARTALEFVIDGCTELRQAERELERALAAPAGADDERIAHLHAQLDELDAWQVEARAGQILDGLGFGAADQRKPHRAFSGGWRIRLNLARALMTPADLLLLDEPTNHLDLEATLWLEGWLRRAPFTLLAIAHDRDFLDNATDHILHIADRGGRLYRGGYSAFERSRAEALSRQQARYERQQHQIAHMEAFITRFRAKASKARQAQSRLKALERMDRALPVHLETPYSFAIEAPRRMSHPLVSRLLPHQSWSTWRWSPPL
jgi:ATP-binding cassette subfamily F protein 3